MQLLFAMLSSALQKQLRTALAVLECWVTSRDCDFCSSASAVLDVFGYITRGI